MAPTPGQVREALVPVVDPELDLSIVALGLVRDVDVDADAGHVHVAMTLTSPFCPLGPQIVMAAEQAVAGLPGVTSARIDLVWEPPWDPRRDADEDVKALLGIWD